MATKSSYAQDNSATSTIGGDTIKTSNLILSSYTDLDVPSGATINGIILTWTGGTTEGWDSSSHVMFVNNGDGYSSGVRSNAVLSESPSLSSATYGGATNLWGLTWTVNQANSIRTKFNTDINEEEEIAPIGVHDAFQITIHYTPLTPGKITISSGLVKISSGKITL